MGTVKGVERDRRKPQFGEYFVKHRKDRYPYYDKLSSKYYGAESGWVLLKHKVKQNMHKKAKK